MRVAWQDQVEAREVAIYEYRCPVDGAFEALRPLGTAPESIPCRICGQVARRVITAPRIKTAARSAWHAAIDHAQRSRHEPEVVTSLPPAGSGPRRGSIHPAMLNLPRP